MLNRDCFRAHNPGTDDGPVGEVTIGFAAIESPAPKINFTVSGAVQHPGANGAQHAELADRLNLGGFRSGKQLAARYTSALRA